MTKYTFIIYLFIFGLFLPLCHVQAGTILSSYKYAWSDNVGYINFAPANGGVIVNDNALSGYAWSENTGYINFAPSNGGVFNDGAGDLSGSAWGEGLGYIDFENVSIDPATGKFSGTATGVLVGTITFDCPNYCDVRTDWSHSSSNNKTSGSVPKSNLTINNIITNILDVGLYLGPNTSSKNAFSTNDTSSSLQASIGSVLPDTISEINFKSIFKSIVSLLTISNVAKTVLLLLILVIIRWVVVYFAKK